MAEKRYQAVIVGGGAAGMTAAIAALEEIRKRKGGKSGGSVLLLESNDRVGKKLLATGNGKCNFTHENIGADNYHTDDRGVLESVLAKFPTEAALQFFERLGMLSKEKNGYFYPLSGTASTVLDVLRLRLAELGCEMLCGIWVERIHKTERGFRVCVQGPEKQYKVFADNVILATGSKAGGFLQDRREDPLRPAESLRLRSTPLYPALTKCVCREDYYYRQLAGVRAQVELSLYAERDSEKNSGKESGYSGKEIFQKNTEYNRKKFEGIKSPVQRTEKNKKVPGDVSDSWELLRQECGELQLTKEGISGIAVFQLSGDIAQRLAEKKRVFVAINFLPDFSEDMLEEWIKKRLSLLPGRSLEEFFLGVLHKKILTVCLQAEGLRGNMRMPCEYNSSKEKKFDERCNVFCQRSRENVSAEKRAFMMAFSVMQRAMHFTTEVTAVSDMKQAQVCRGGLLLSQFDGNLECKTIPGLFACGEVLNVDGECGGYNLHFAWASGALAGRGAARRMKPAFNTETASRT